MAQAWGDTSAADSGDKGGTDWSTGPESLVKKSMLIGDLPAAVEVCLKSGRMADALLLASGGGTDLWVRTRDEYLRLQGDPFLKCVGNIMTQEFDALVAAADLSKWMETLAVLATYSGAHYQRL
jgi:protein transport protein SEC31